MVERIPNSKLGNILQKTIPAPPLQDLIDCSPWGSYWGSASTPRFFAGIRRTTHAI